MLMMVAENNVCLDIEGWEDSGGYLCSQYRDTCYDGVAKGHVAFYEWSAVEGLSSLDACCSCGGGSYSVTSSSGNAVLHNISVSSGTIQESVHSAEVCVSTPPLNGNDFENGDNRFCSCGICETIMFQRIEVNAHGGASINISTAIAFLEDASKAMPTSDATRFVAQIMLSPGSYDLDRAAAANWSITYDLHISGAADSNVELRCMDASWVLWETNQVLTHKIDKTDSFLNRHLHPPRPCWNLKFSFDYAGVCS